MFVSVCVCMCKTLNLETIIMNEEEEKKTEKPKLNKLGRQISSPFLFSFYNVIRLP